MLAALSLGAGAVPASGADPQNGFKTKQPAMLAVGPNAPLGTEIKPIITVGDTIGGYRYEAIPDGISLIQSGKNEANVFVNHETSTVPFPYTAAPDTGQLAERLRQLAAQQADDPQRRCRPRRFHDHPEQCELPAILLETPRHDREQGSAGRSSSTTRKASTGSRRPVRPSPRRKRRRRRPPDRCRRGLRCERRRAPYKTIWGMGRLNHENNVAVPGYGKPSSCPGDDAFVTSNRPVAGLRVHREQC